MNNHRVTMVMGAGVPLGFQLQKDLLIPSTRNITAFLYQSVKDNDIRSVFVENFKTVFDNAFESDIIRATEDLCKALTDEDSKFDEVEVLTEFLKAINTSKFENFALLRKILEDNLIKQGLLQKAIERCKAAKVTLSLFKEGTLESAQSAKVDGK